MARLTPRECNRQEVTGVRERAASPEPNNATLFYGYSNEWCEMKDASGEIPGNGLVVDLAMGLTSRSKWGTAVQG